MAPSTMKRSVGEYSSARKLPTTVRCWLMATANTGTTIIMLCTMLMVISQEGTGPPMRWCPPTWL